MKLNKSTERLFAYIFGVVFITVSIVIAIVFPSPTDFQLLIFRIILALSSAGVVTMIPGFITVEVSNNVRAGGAVAVFVIIYFFSPAELAISEKMLNNSEHKLIIVLMDSTIPKQVYDPDTRSKGGTNADDISNILKDLPVQLIKESTSLQWSREEQLLDINPDLIIMHMSAFYSETNSQDSDNKIKTFFQYMKNSKSQFLLYSRGVTPDFDEGAKYRVLYEYYSVLNKERFHLFGMNRLNATFRNPEIARELKLKVKSILNL